VAASLPAGVLTAVVTGQAGLIGLTRRDLSELPNVALRVVVDVGLTRTVTAFAALPSCRRAWILRLRVGRAFQRVLVIGMAQRARVAADVTDRGRRRGSLRARRRGSLRARGLLA